MKTPHKTILLSSGIALGVIAVVFGATAGIADKHKNFESASAEQYTLILDSSNTPAELTDSYQDTVTTTVKTNLNNSLTFNFVLAKASSGKYVQLAKNGYMYNFGAADGRITGINAITATFSGSLKARTTNSELSNGGAFLSDPVSLPSGTRVELTDPVRYFELKAGDSGAEITSLKIEYTCSGAAASIPSGLTYNVEDFESYTADGSGYDSSNKNKANTTNLRSSFYSTYYGATDPDPTQESNNWSIMGSSDYLTYNSSNGRNTSKTAFFKVNNGNNFRYVQTKATFGINSVIGKGAQMSFWMHGAYSNKTGTSAYDGSVTVTLMAFYNSLFATGSNGATTKTVTVAANSDWTQYLLNLDTSKNYYAFGVYLKKLSSGTAYLPIDDVAILPGAPVTGVSLNTNNVTIDSGKTTTLVATVAPSNARNNQVIWTTSNSSVATVNNGVVTGVSAGNATITATTEEGGYTATCAVTVRAPQVYLDGTFVGSIRVSGINFEAVIASSSNEHVVFSFFGQNATITSYTNNGSTFSIVTTGSVSVKYSSKTYTITTGTISGSINNGNYSSCSISGLKVNGSSTNPSNNGSISFTKQTSSSAWINNCDGTRSELQSVFGRRYRASGTDSWTYDTGNGNRVDRNTTHILEGTGSMSFRGYNQQSTNQAALTLTSDNTSIFSGKKNISFWVYNNSSSALTIKLFVYNEANWGGTANNLRDFVIQPNTWTFATCGYENTVYNFQLFVQNAPSDALYYDYFCIYN